MAEPKSEYVEFRNDGYYIAASRVSLDTVVYAFRRGESPETIFKHFPAIGSLAKVYGAIAFALDHPAEIDEYLAGQEREWEAAREQNPVGVAEKVRRAREGRAIRSS
jgi:uncharacterized protein (DUF433 family)